MKGFVFQNLFRSKILLEKKFLNLKFVIILIISKFLSLKIKQLYKSIVCRGDVQEYLT
jgi:hypothetical protein